MALETKRNLGNLWNRLVMNRKNWWFPLLIVMAIGIGSMLYVGSRTYQDAPPIPDFTSASGEAVVPSASILRGQVVFQKYALMDYGSMFGDGAARGPDYTADALHHMAASMQAFYLALPGQAAVSEELQRAAVQARVQLEMKKSRHDPASNRVTLTPGQVHAYDELVRRYTGMFRGEGPEAMKPTGYITDAGELKDLSSFFFWGAWVCGTERPGASYSYTHNWPYDELAGNRPSSAIVFWSVAAALGLILALGVMLFLYGRYSQIAGWHKSSKNTNATVAVRTDTHLPTAAQRATYKLFAMAMLLFVLQMVAGVLTIHDFLGLTTFFGVDISRFLPITVTRGWHLQLALLWISVCWIGASIFVVSTTSKNEPPGQLGLINLLFALLAVLAGGTLVGVLLGPLGHLGAFWHMFGNQGWEFVELGKAWQALMFIVFVLWAVVIGRAVKPVWRSGDAWILPKWLFYAVASIVVLFLSAFVATPTTNFVIADFWRWAVVHMWAEAFFEVFTTVLLAYFMVMMGFASHAAASRIVYLATLLFLGSGLLGISHNFYWNAKPVATLAIGGIFSTLQVVPLILLTLEAWQFRKLPDHAPQQNRGTLAASFNHEETFLFLLGVNFWNFLGAGVFGFIINLPIVNYYEHSTYLTVNHGHAALMGVYGNLALAAILFCSRYLIAAESWDRRLLRRAFWSINIGLALMIVIDLFPVGVQQFSIVLEQGLWAARSQAFIQGVYFQALTWARILGGALFVLGGVLPVAWFIFSRLGALKPAMTEHHPGFEGMPLDATA
ncbi:MAG TPA: cbb3-type cytochrome c oxidase subunit I [Burkholderiaceae bacterium]|nr:cbb3-type cytochrome c oxidase subunit I [Burkholderiaceae bacterium]